MFMPSSLAILREAYPHAKERAHAIGIWSALTAIAGACGPLFGGALVASLGWRSIFLLNLPVGIVAVPMVVRFVRPSPAGARRGFDLPAQIAGAFALALLTWALIERSAFGWSSPRMTSSGIRIFHAVILAGSISRAARTRNGSPRAGHSPGPTA